MNAVEYKVKRYEDLLGINNSDDSCILSVKKWLGKNEVSTTGNDYISAIESINHTDSSKFDDYITKEVNKPDLLPKVKGCKYLFVQENLWGFFLHSNKQQNSSLFLRRYKINYCDDKVTLAVEPTPGKLERRLWSKVSKTSRFSEISKYLEYNVLAVHAQPKVLGFISYDEVYLTYSELRSVLSKSEWQEKLGEVQGVYIIKDEATGGIYIGSATGGRGLLQRWSDYAENPTGGNKVLTELLVNKKNRKQEDTHLSDIEYAENYFKYSIIETFHLKKSDKEIKREEYLWMKKLGTTSEYHLN